MTSKLFVVPGFRSNLGEVEQQWIVNRHHDEIPHLNTYGDVVLQGTHRLHHPSHIIRLGLTGIDDQLRSNQLVQHLFLMLAVRNVEWRECIHRKIE